MLWGSLNFLYVVAFSVLLPMYTLTALTSLSINGINLTFGQQDYDVMILWLYRTGYLMAALAFFKASSPKYSKRRAWGNLLQNAAYVFYIFMFKFSGTSDITLTGSGIFISLDVTPLLVLYMGLVFLYVCLSIWELIDTALWAKDRAEKAIKKEIEKKRKKGKKGEFNPDKGMPADSRVHLAATLSRSPQAKSNGAITDEDEEDDFDV